MGSTPSPPPAPDPYVQQQIAQQGAATASKAQAQYNLDALRQSQAATMINQNSAVGSISYDQRGQDQYGNALYSMNSQLSPQEQQLFNQTVGTQAMSGAVGQNLLNSSAPMYADAGTMLSNIFSGADSLSGQRINAALGFQQPFMQQDRGYLDNQLRNQGIMPDSPAYKRQMAELDKQQYGNQENFISQVMPQSQQTAQSAYMMPAQLQAQFAQQGAPAQINQMQSPQFNAAPSDYVGPYGSGLNAQTQNYQNQIAGYNAQLGAQSNMMSGLFGMGAAGIKALPMMPGIGGAGAAEGLKDVAPLALL